MNGLKTYAVAIVLVCVGMLAILVPDSSTYEAPSGQAKVYLGYLMIALAASTASLRHAISKLREELEDDDDTE